LEVPVSNRTITHELKLQPSVIIILGLLALGVFANAFARAVSIKEALAELEFGDMLQIDHSGSITVF